MPPRKSKKKTSKAGSRKKPVKSKVSSKGKRKPPVAKNSRAIPKEVRQAEVVKLRFIQRWSIKDLATHFEVSEKTIVRDIRDAREIQLKEAKANLENEVRYIIEDLKLSFDEKIKFQWNQFAEVMNQDKPLSEMIEEIRDALKSVKDPHEIASLARQLAKLVDSQLTNKQQRLSIIRQITETESCHVDMLKKLGIAGPSFDLDEDNEVLLVQIKERYAKRNKNTANSSGGGDGKPSGKAK